MPKLFPPHAVLQRQLGRAATRHAFKSGSCARQLSTRNSFYRLPPNSETSMPRHPGVTKIGFWELYESLPLHRAISNQE